MVKSMEEMGCCWFVVVATLIIIAIILVAGVPK